MRPGQLKPNEFEIAILERLASKDPSIVRSLGQLHLLSREFTGVDSFTNFKCEDSAVGSPQQIRQLGRGTENLSTSRGEPVIACHCRIN